VLRSQLLLGPHVRCDSDVMDLVGMHLQAPGCVQLAVAFWALEVLVLLVLHQRRLILELAVAVEAPGLLLLLRFLLLASHAGSGLGVDGCALIRLCMCWPLICALCAAGCL
jgi:hypothetical protein